MGSNWLNVNSSHGGGRSPVVGWWRHVPVSDNNVLVVIHLYRVNMLIQLYCIKWFIVTQLRLCILYPSCRFMHAHIKCIVITCTHQLRTNSTNKHVAFLSNTHLQ